MKCVHCGCTDQPESVSSRSQVHIIARATNDHHDKICFHHRVHGPPKLDCFSGLMGATRRLKVVEDVLSAGEISDGVHVLRDSLANI